MGKIWVTSDLHFCHDREFVYHARGFNSVHEMNKTIVENWNSLVEPEDDVYLLGDVMLGDLEDGLACLAQLHGRIHVIVGNHDTDNRLMAYIELPNVAEIQSIKILKYKGCRLYLSHYPTLVGNYDDGRSIHRGLLNLCGHSHATDPFADWDKGRIYHCELDAHDCKPVLLDEILEKCEEKLKNGA